MFESERVRGKMMVGDSLSCGPPDQRWPGFSFCGMISAETLLSTGTARPLGGRVFMLC